MKKTGIISLILFLVLFTAVIKNSTKKLEDKIFTTNENLRSLNKELENVKLEFDFLSSSEKLLNFQNLYFDEELIQKEIKEIKIIKNQTKKFNFETNND